MKKYRVGFEIYTEGCYGCETIAVADVTVPDTVSKDTVEEVLGRKTSWDFGTVKRTLMLAMLENPDWSYEFVNSYDISITN